MTRPRPFSENAKRALADAQLQRALSNVGRGFVAKRALAVAALPEFDLLRDEAVSTKDHTLAHLDLYLEAFEAAATGLGSEVHWARDAAAARAVVLDICHRSGAKKIAKGKSMVSEEIGLNPALDAAGHQVIETDLGEYVIQLRRETPSHIIAPAIHLNREQIADDFRKAHAELHPSRFLDDAESLVAEARQRLRAEFLSADVGITGANLLIAETGQSVIVTNEGNGDLTQTLPRVQIVIASIEKVVPTVEDACTILRLLARSATGQDMSCYTTFSVGPRREGDPDGPLETHVVLIDNGRTEMLGNEFRDMLRCIRCGACLNHCPVYATVGGHAYGGVYPGPMGAVLSPALLGLAAHSELPAATTACGRCADVCPMRIPLPDLMRRWRIRAFAAGDVPWFQRNSVRTWAAIAKRPRLYRALMSVLIPLLGILGRKGTLPRLRMTDPWGTARDLPAPEGRTFMQLWRGKK